jgi:predicted transposase/invertase (TIGR01784 family)
VEELLLSRFPQFDREDIRMKFKLHDIRESKVWKEAHEGGVEVGIEKGIEKGKVIAKREMIESFIAQGIPHEQIAKLMNMPVDEIRRTAKNH